MSEQKEFFQELKEEKLEQVNGGRDYRAGDHIECYRHIKWVVESVMYVSLGPKYSCRAISWPDNWDGWVKAIDYTTSVMGSQVIGTW